MVLENSHLPAVDPATVAQTIAAIRRHESPGLAARFQEDPRSIELLWFIQSRSGAPDGLSGLVRQVARACPDSIGSPAVDLVRTARRGADHRAAVSRVLNEVPAGVRASILGELDFWFRMDPRFRDAYEDDDSRESAFLERLDEINAETLHQVCADSLPARLPGFLARLCSEPNASLWEEDLWYLRQPIAALFQVMEQHAAAELARLADTSVSQAIFDDLDYAWKVRDPVWIDGPPRHGKSACLRTYCAAYPGRARYLPIPFSDSDNDLFRAVAKALGVRYDGNTAAWRVREAITWIMDHANIMLVFDEAQFLYPARSAGRCSPTRLNWLRTEVVDRGLPCVLCTTPQGYSYAERKFRKATSYPMEQWLGRWIRRLELPALLSREDLLAVARHWFPGLPAPDLEDLAGRALGHDGQLKAIEAVANRAGWLAGQDGRAQATLSDARQALGELLPSALCTPVAEAAQPPGEAPAAAPRTARRPARESHFVAPGRQDKQHGRISPASLVSA